MNKFGLMGILILGCMFSWDIFRGSSRKGPIKNFQRIEGILFRGHLDLKESPIPKADPLPAPVAKIPKKVRKKEPAAPLEVSMISVSSPIVSMPPPTKNDPDEKNFKYFDAVLGRSPSAFTFYGRLTKGDVTIRLEQLCKWENFYLLKYTIENSGVGEFFISSVRLRAGRQFLRVMNFAPVSCSPHDVVFGIIRFPINDAANQKISLILKESGHQYREFELVIHDYKFT